MATIEFKAYNERERVRIYHTRLPHWRQDGATYFVTIRLGDALPRRLLDSWRLELIAWLNANGVKFDPKRWPDQLRRLPLELQQQYSKLAGSRLDKYLDQGAGSCILVNPVVRGIVKAGLHYFDRSRLLCGDYVIMPNHIHWLVAPLHGHELETCLKSIKGFVAKEINRWRNQNGRVWQHSSYDHIVRNMEELSHCRRYIASNPEKAGIALSQNEVFSAKWRALGGAHVFD